MQVQIWRQTPRDLEEDRPLAAEVLLPGGRGRAGPQGAGAAGLKRHGQAPPPQPANQEWQAGQRTPSGSHAGRAHTLTHSYTHTHTHPPTHTFSH